MFPLVHPFTWGLWLVGVPVLIHLINMLRHQHVSGRRWNSPGEPEEAADLGHSQAIAPAFAADGGHCPGGAGSGPAASAGPLGQLPRGAAHASLRGSGRQLFDVGETQALRRPSTRQRRRSPASAIDGPPPRAADLHAPAASRLGGRYGGTRPDFQKETVDADFAQRLATTLERLAFPRPLPSRSPPFDAVQQLLGKNAGDAASSISFPTSAPASGGSRTT